MNPEQIKQEQEQLTEYTPEPTGVVAAIAVKVLGLCDVRSLILVESEWREVVASPEARAYLALLDAHLALHAQLAQAEEREARMAAECDMYRVTLQNLHQAAANMLTGIEVNNRLHPDAPARRKDIAGPVVTSLRAAVLSARVALSPNPPTGYAPPPAQAPASAEGGAE